MSRPAASLDQEMPPMRQYLAILRRRRRTVITTFIAAMVAAVPFIAALPPLYRASATILIEGNLPEVAQGPAGGTVEDRLETIKQEALTRARLTELVEQFDLYPALRRTASPEAAMQRLQSDVTLKPITANDRSGLPSTIAFTLNYIGPEAQKTSQVANALASFYMTQNDRNRSRQASQNLEVLEKQLAEMRQRVEQENKKLMGSTARNSGSLPESVIVSLSQLDRMNSQLQANLDAQNKLAERRYALQNELGQLDRGALPDPNDPSSRLAAKRKELATLLSSVTEDHPDVRLLKRDIAGLEKQAAAAGPTGNGGSTTQRAMIQSQLNDINSQVSKLETDNNMLRSEIRSFEGRMVSSAVRSPEVQHSQADYLAARSSLDALQKRHDDARLAADVENRQGIQEYRLLEAAVTPNAAVGPNRMRLLLGAMVAALALALALALVVERLDDAFYSVDDIRRFTRVPVLASIPRIDTPGESRRRFLKTAMVTGASTVALALVAAMAFYLASGNEQAARLLLRMG